ncbi:hypothetical protein ACWEOZ_40690 [Actinoplanes sp. NPDC004185]
MQVLVATVVSIAVLAIQGVWLASSYVVVNGVASFVLNRPVHDGPHWGEFIASLRWDVVSIAYVVLAGLALVIQYRRGGSADDGNPARTLIMMPLTVIGGFAALLSGRTREMMKRAWQKPPEEPDVSPVRLGWDRDGRQPDRWEQDRSRRRGGAGS